MFSEIDLKNMKPELYVRGSNDLTLDNMKACHTVVKLTGTGGTRSEDRKECQGTLSHLHVLGLSLP